MATKKKTTKKVQKRNRLIKKLIYFFTLFIIVATGTGITIVVNNQGKVEIKADSHIEYASNNIPAVIEAQGQTIETTEYNGEQIPTVDEVDGGQFKDKDTGLSLVDGQYNDLGWAETYNVSSPEAFRDDTLGKCIIANNYYGAQCVSLARVFWWSYANRDVSTCGTGMAKGMMNCWEDNAGTEFETHWGNEGIEDGDWIISDAGAFGHICMALGSVYNGYVACLGENQGGRSCGQDIGGAATNIINFNVKNVIGYYRPKAYIKPVPTPEPSPVYNDCTSINVKAGDTLSDIMLKCEGEVDWEKMNDYAKSWFSQTTGNSVYYGWSHDSGYGLYAEDVIERK